MNLLNLLERLPALTEAPWGKEIPANAKIEVDYLIPLTKRVPERMIGYVFGTNNEKDILYFSNTGRKLDGSFEILAPNIGLPSLEVKFIAGIYVETLLS